MSNQLDAARETPSRRWTRFALSGAWIITVITLVAISLGLSGAITVNGALSVLVGAWATGTVLFYVAEPVWGIPAKRRMIITVFISLGLAVFLILVGLFETAHGKAPDLEQIKAPVMAARPAMAPPLSKAQLTSTEHKHQHLVPSGRSYATGHQIPPNPCKVPTVVCMDNDHDFTVDGVYGDSKRAALIVMHSYNGSVSNVMSSPSATPTIPVGTFIRPHEALPSAPRLPPDIEQKMPPKSPLG